MAISLQPQKEKELIFVAITKKKIAALMHNSLETPSEIPVILKIGKLDNNKGAQKQAYNYLCSGRIISPPLENGQIAQ